MDRAFAEPAIRQFVDALWAEAISTLPEDAGLYTSTYTAELAERFSNPALAHRTAQIANDGSQKLPQRIIASAIDCLEAGGEMVHLTLVVAAWIAACAARGNTLPESHFDRIPRPDLRRGRASLPYRRAVVVDLLAPTAAAVLISSWASNAILVIACVLLLFYVPICN